MATNVLDAVLAQYEQSKQSGSSSTSKMSQEERMKKYFAAILKDTEKQGQRRIRILPTSDGSSPFKEVWFHEIQVDGKYQKFYDPGKNDNERSPLNEVYEELMSTGKESDKELAKQYKPRKFYIVKVIDRENEQDGPKFWRFKHNYKQEGIFDKIHAQHKGKKVEFAKRTKISIDKIHADCGVATTSTVIVTPHGFIPDDKDEEKAYKAAHAPEWFGTNVNVDEIQITEDNSEWEESRSISPMIEIDNDEVEVK